MIRAGQSIAATAAILGQPDKSLHNLLKMNREGQLGPGAEPVTHEKMVLARLRAALGKTKIQLTNVKKGKRTSRKGKRQIRFDCRHCSLWRASC